MGNCSTTPHKHQRHRYIPVSDVSSSNDYSPPANTVKRDEAKTNHHNDDLLSLVGTSNNNTPTSPYLEMEMISSPTTDSNSEGKSLIDHIPTQYSPIIQTPYSPIILTPPSTTTRLVGADNDDTVSVVDYTKPRPQSEETIIRAAHPSTPQVESIASNVRGDGHADSAKQETASTPKVQVSSSDMNEKVHVSSTPTEVKVTKSDTTSQLTESSLIALVDIDSKSSSIQPRPLQSSDIAVPNIMMVSPKNNKTRLVKGVRFEKSVRDIGAQQVRDAQHLPKTDHNHQQQTLNDTRKHQNLARFALVVLACLYMLCCGMLGWAGMKAVSSVSILFLDPPSMIENIAFDVVRSGEQPTTQSIDNKSSLLFHKTKHKASRLGLVWYKSISEELLAIDDVNNGMMLI